MPQDACFFDLDFNSNPNFNILLRDIMKRIKRNNSYGIVIYSSTQLMNMLEKASPYRKEFIINAYGLEDGIYKDDLQLSEERGVTLGGVKILRIKSLKDLAILSKLEQLLPYPYNQLLYTESNGTQKKSDLDSQKEILANELLNIAACNVNSSIEDKDRIKEQLNKLKAKILISLGHTIPDASRIDLTSSIDVLDFSNKISNILKRNGVFTINELINTNDYALRTMNGMGEGTYAIVSSKIRDLKDEISKTQVVPQDIFENRSFVEISIMELGLPRKAANALFESGIVTVEDLLSCNKNTLIKMPGLGRILTEEVLQKITMVKVIQRERKRKRDMVLATPKASFGIDQKELEDVSYNPTITELENLRRRKGCLVKQNDEFSRKVVQARRYTELIALKNKEYYN